MYLNRLGCRAPLFTTISPIRSNATYVRGETTSLKFPYKENRLKYIIVIIISNFSTDFIRRTSKPLLVLLTPLGIFLTIYRQGAPKLLIYEYMKQ